MFAYAFMRRALVVGLLLGLIIPLMGVVVINRRTATIGDALAHTSLAGIGLSLMAGFAPLLGAVLMTLLGAFSIEFLRRKFSKNGDLATAMVLSVGVGLASLFSDFAPVGANLESYLFGSIMATSDLELGLVFILSLLVVGSFFFFYYPLLFISMDPVGASISGLPARWIDSFFTVLLALTISLSAKTIGILMVSSLLILPVASAMLFCRSYRKTCLWAVAFGLLLVISGLLLSYYFSLKPGGAIVLMGVGVFVLCLFLRRLLPSRGQAND